MVVLLVEPKFTWNDPDPTLVLLAEAPISTYWIAPELSVVELAEPKSVWKLPVPENTVLLAAPPATMNCCWRRPRMVVPLLTVHRSTYWIAPEPSVVARAEPKSSWYAPLPTVVPLAEPPLKTYCSEPSPMIVLLAVP